MKINFTDYDFTDFMVKEGSFCGEWSKLITPNHIGTKFTQRNKIFRSSIWSVDGQLLSAGLPKFVNFSENPDNFPVPLSINNCSFVEKIDGSLTCIDFFNNQISMRTRGTFSIDTMENKPDFELCLSKYPTINEWLKQNSHYTLLFEITTPNLKIVLDYGNKPDFWLVGAISKNDYSLMPQSDLDILGKILGVERPQSFSFNSIEELLRDVSKWIGREGICLYSKRGQEIHKIKAEVYLKLHRFKENATLDNTLELFVEYGCPPYMDFENKLQTQFDYECWNMIRGYASQVCDAYKEVLQIIAHMKEFVEKHKNLTRKDFAILTFKSYGGEGNNRSNFVFQILDGKNLMENKDAIKKLLFQVLKK